MAGSKPADDADWDRIAALSAGPPAPLLLTGINEFNRRDFYKCHETLERVWMAEQSSLKSFYQGVIQVAVAFVHVQRHNYRGAHSLLQRGLGKIRPFAPACNGIDVAGLVSECEGCLSELEALGEAGLAGFDPSRFPTIHVRD